MPNLRYGRGLLGIEERLISQVEGETAIEQGHEHEYVHHAHYTFMNLNIISIYVEGAPF